MKKYNKYSRSILLALAVYFLLVSCSKNHGVIEETKPHFLKQGTATQLVVNGKPLLMLGGELGNSSTSDFEYMRDIWPKLAKMNLNTVLAPVYWELMEPVEGQYDFGLIDSMILGAREQNLHLVFLWFGTWKNSMSCYTPMWVKTDPKRFPRMKDRRGKGQEIFSVFSEEMLIADAKAFSALMSHIKMMDEKHQTVVMVQVENEIGMLPEARDWSEEATKAYRQKVPKQLLDYMTHHKDSLISNFMEQWKQQGMQTEGTWEEVFGYGLSTEEIFMAWHFAQFSDKVAFAGKQEYNIPMYVNAALNYNPVKKPGEYPSAGPLAHLMDVWKAGAPSIDILAPDIYNPNFREWCKKYKRYDNPLFIPESGLGDHNAAYAFYCIGKFDCMGFSPFSIESTSDVKGDPIVEAYLILEQLSPIILNYQGKGVMNGFMLDSVNQIEYIDLGGYRIKIRHEYNWLKKTPEQLFKENVRVGGLIINTAPDEFIIAGKGMLVTFKPIASGDSIAGIGFIDEGKFVNGQWKAGRRLNGDQNHQGRHMHLTFDKYQIQKIKLYRYN